MKSINSLDVIFLVFFRLVDKGLHTDLWNPYLAKETALLRKKFPQQKRSQQKQSQRLLRKIPSKLKKTPRGLELKRYWSFPQCLAYEPSPPRRLKQRSAVLRWAFESSLPQWSIRVTWLILCTPIWFPTSFLPVARLALSSRRQFRIAAVNYWQ